MGIPKSVKAVELHSLDFTPNYFGYVNRSLPQPTLSIMVFSRERNCLSKIVNNHQFTNLF